MRKLFSLDFLNKEKFNADILSHESEKLFSKGDEITPEIILKLYFQDIYKIVEPVVLPDGVDKNSALARMLNEDNENDFDESGVDRIPFDAAHAKRVTQYSLELAKILGLRAQEIEKLEVAAYFHDIGKTLFTQEDAAAEDFGQKFTQAGYDYLINVKRVDEPIAHAAKAHLDKCNFLDFSLTPGNPFGIAHQDIIAIANCYDELMNNSPDKETALRRLLRLGGNRFNIFLLHKFIRAMRVE